MARASYQRIDGIKLGAKKIQKKQVFKAVKPNLVPQTSSFVPAPKPLRAILKLKY